MLENVSHAEFNDVLQQCQAAAAMVPDAIKCEVRIDVAKPRMRWLKPLVMALVSDPLADGHTGKILSAEYVLGSGETFAVCLDPMTPHAKWKIDYTAVGRLIYRNQFV